MAWKLTDLVLAGPWLTLIDWSNPCRTLAPPTWWRWGRLCTGKVFLRRGILTTTTSTGSARQVLCSGSKNYYFETLQVNHKRQIVDRWRTYHVTYKCLRAQVNTSQAMSNIDRWAPRWLGRTRRGGSNSSNSDYALFGAPGCFTWRGNLYGRQPGGLRRKSAMLLVWFFDHRLAGSIRESQAGLGESNFLRWALDPTQRFSISTLVGKNTAILVLQSHRESSMMERC